MQVFLETVIYPIANSINDYTMKKQMKTLALVAMSLLTISSFTACDDDWDDEHFSRAVVTLKTEPSTGQPYMQVTDSTVVFPTNLTTAPYGGKEVRAIVDFKFDDNATAHAGRSVTVLRMDTIRTKDMAPSLSDNDKVYGNDPLELINSWTTVWEDNYLTLHFQTRFGGNKTHYINLIQTAKDTLELRQNANGDTDGPISNGLIAFRLKDISPDDGNHIIQKWKSYRGVKTIKLSDLRK